MLLGYDIIKLYKSWGSY